MPWPDAGCPRLVEYWCQGLRNRRARGRLSLTGPVLRDPIQIDANTYADGVHRTLANLKQAAEQATGDR
jgi:hypothetical protein